MICCQVLRLGREVMAMPGQESRSILDGYQWDDHWDFNGGLMG